MPRRLTKDELRRAHQRTGEQDQPKASTIIRHLDELEAKDLLAVPYMRVSTREQRRQCNLKNRLSALRRELRRKGIDWHASFTQVETGTSLENRPKLVEAIEAARRLQAENPGATVAVVTDTRNRFLRGKFYNGRASTDPPTPRQWAELKKLADGITLATVLPPDATFGKVRGHETLIARNAGKRVGRPPKRPTVQKKKRREELLPKARRLRDRDLSVRQIAGRLGVPISTIGRWLKP